MYPLGGSEPSRGSYGYKPGIAHVGNAAWVRSTEAAATMGQGAPSMGMFKNLKDTIVGAAELTETAREMQKESGQPAPGMFGLGATAGMVQDANAMMKDLQAQQAKATRLMSVGVVGQGTIKAIRDTGVQVNYQPQFEIDLDVAIPDRETYQATLTQVVALAVLPQFQPGAVMPVRVDPDDPNVLMIG